MLRALVFLSAFLPVWPANADPSHTVFRLDGTAYTAPSGQTVREKCAVWENGDFLEILCTQHPDGNQGASAIHYAFAKSPETWTSFVGNPVISGPDQLQDMSVWRDGDYYGFVEVNDSFLQLYTSPDGLAWTADPNWILLNAASAAIHKRVIDENNVEWLLFYEDFTTSPYSIALRRAPTIQGLLSATPSLVWQEPGNNDAVPDSVIRDASGMWWLYSHIEDLPSSNWPIHYQTSLDLVNWSAPQRVLGNDGLPLPDEYTAPFVFEHDGRIRMFATANPDSGPVLLFTGDDDPPPPPPPGPIFTVTINGVPTDFPVQGTPGFTTRPGGVPGAALVCDGDDSVGLGLRGENLKNGWVIEFHARGSAPAYGTPNGPVHLESTGIPISWNHVASAWRDVAAIETSDWFSAGFGNVAWSDWNRFKVSYQGGVLSTEVNGAPQDSISVGAPADVVLGETMHICRTSSGSAHWAGDIDGLKIDYP